MKDWRSEPQLRALIFSGCLYTSPQLVLELQVKLCSGPKLIRVVSNNSFRQLFRIRIFLDAVINNYQRWYIL
jgi:hypothetical protein